MAKEHVRIDRAYVVVDSGGMWLSRPFGSAKAALEAARRTSNEWFTILEIHTGTAIVEV